MYALRLAAGYLLSWEVVRVLLAAGWSSSRLPRAAVKTVFKYQNLS